MHAEKGNQIAQNNNKNRKDNIFNVKHTPPKRIEFLKIIVTGPSEWNASGHQTHQMQP